MRHEHDWKEAKNKDFDVFTCACGRITITGVFTEVKK